MLVIFNYEAITSQPDVQQNFRTNLDVLQCPTVKDIFQVSKKIRNPATETRFLQGIIKAIIPTTVIAQTEPVSYTVKTTDDVWRHHVKQLLRVSPGTF